jgi:hypothetical protein
MCRIPDRLWKIAAKLSPQYPISTICENLGLNWGALKKKIDQSVKIKNEKLRQCARDCCLTASGGVFSIFNF